MVTSEIQPVDTKIQFSNTVIIDSNGMNCQMANFAISPVTTTTRKWNIRVTHYECGMEDSAGPPGCLQYYTSTVNTIQK